jgi:short-subunit dehydrogenase
MEGSTMTADRHVALITGASSGIGAALAERLARDGKDLVIVARRRERLEALAQRLEEETGARVEVLPADLTDREQLIAVEERLVADPHIDMLVNNAGFGGYGSFADLEPAFGDRLIDIHARAPMRLTRAALPGMITRGEGAIVNIASMLALSGPVKMRMSGRATYAGAKSFLLTFTQALAQELEFSNVHAMVCLPGMVETEFHRSHHGDAPRPSSMMTAADVAQAIVVGLELGEVICVPGLEDIHLFAQLRDTQQATLFGGNSQQLAQRYRR